MYNLFRRTPARYSGSFNYPDKLYIERLVQTQINTILNHYTIFPKRVDSDNPLGNLLFHIPLKPELDDVSYVRYVEDIGAQVSRNFHFVSPIYRGKFYGKGFLLGKDCIEAVVLDNRRFDVKDFGKRFKEESAVNYLYHTRTDLGMPILNNHTKGKGYGVCSVNIPMMALQRRYWLREQDASLEQKESIYRFIGSIVLPNIVKSYVDIAFFNRMERYSLGIKNSSFPCPHPFFIADTSRYVDSVITKIVKDNDHRSNNAEQFVTTTPLLFRSLREVMFSPEDMVTRNNEWALLLSRLPYIRYMVNSMLAKENIDKTSLNEIYIGLDESRSDNIFSGLGNNFVIDKYKLEIKDLMERIKAA